MKTLVIHPSDLTTDFLSVIYEGKGWTVITDGQISKKILKEQIKAHDKIIMLGHGTENGLISGEIYNYRFIIDSSLVYLLREKYCVCIWCNADEFVEKYDLKGFYTGMIISEYEEALMFGINPSLDEIYDSNILFADAMKKAINSKDSLTEAKKLYYSDVNPVMLFNQEKIYHR